MYVGIEIGGTKLQLGLGLGDGSLAAFWRGDVDVAAGAGGIKQQIQMAVPELLTRAGLARSQIRGVGVGFGGPVDDATRTVIKSHQIEGWDDFPLADWITDLLGWPAVLGNDADVAGLAEALFGAGKGLSPIFYTTIGSGIGGGLIINGEIYRGCGRGAAEIGHLKVFIPEGDAERPYEYLPLEALSSGWGIENLARQFIKRNPKSDSLLMRLAGGRADRVTARDVAQAAQQQDEAALSLLQMPLVHLADGICHVIALLCPRRIIIGGGVSLMGESVLFEPLRDLVAARVFKPLANCYDIVSAALGEEVVVHGALALARRRLGA
jgi:glucokinase